jgi:hypothetical protein
VRSVSRIESPESAANRTAARQPKPSGAWAGYLIFTLCLLVLVAFAAEAGYDRQWPRLAGTIAVILAFLVVPTGGARWLRGEYRRRRPPAQH